MVLALPLGAAAQSDFELAEFYYNEGLRTGQALPRATLEKEQDQKGLRHVLRVVVGNQ